MLGKLWSLPHSWIPYAILALSGLASAFAEDASLPPPSADPSCQELLVSPPRAIQLDPDAWNQSVSHHLMEVAPFEVLRQTCQELGVRCWLFGGTAAGYAHYVKWDMLRKEGDPRYQPERFDYDYSNIYRSTQDADLVIDGTAEQAALLEQAIHAKFPYFQGNKSQWEVRLLRENRGDKGALLNNPDFLHQHTDSNSTGMIEVTIPRDGDPLIRDLRDWNAPSENRLSQFEKDVLEGKLHYFHSQQHETTSRAREGLNPPIFSVIRFLTKAFQYELAIRPEDEALIRGIIDRFDPERELNSAPKYVRNWIERNGSKLFQHAVNLEYAWNELDRLGLRAKLLAIGDIENEDSLAWWMNREPLRSFPIGGGNGRSAADLGLNVVAHETQTFVAYESITRAHTGDPNVFSSRQNVKTENAAHGAGFYTASGAIGARGTGITIRFNVNPAAREGSDFEFIPKEKNQTGKDIVLMRNKLAFRVIPESLDISLIDYVDMLVWHRTFDPNNRGAMQKLKQRLNRRATLLSVQDLYRIENMVWKDLKREDEPVLLSALFELPGLISQWKKLDPRTYDYLMILWEDHFAMSTLAEERMFALQHLKTFIDPIPAPLLTFFGEILDEIPSFAQRAALTEHIRTHIRPGDVEQLRALARELRHPDALRRRFALQVLMEVPTQDWEVISAILGIVGDPDIVEASVMAFKALEQSLAARKDQALIDRLIREVNENPHLRDGQIKVILQAFEFAEVRSPEIQSIYRKILRTSEDDSLRAAAISGLSRFGMFTDEELSTLRGLVTTGSFPLQKTALEALVRFPFQLGHRQLILRTAADPDAKQARTLALQLIQTDPIADPITISVALLAYSDKYLAEHRIGSALLSNLLSMLPPHHESHRRLKRYLDIPVDSGEFRAATDDILRFFENKLSPAQAELLKRKN